MTIFELVARERARVARWVRLGWLLRVAVAVVLALTAGALLLGGARWLALPRLVPFAIWVAAVALAAYLVRRASRAISRVAASVAVADAVEREQRLRHGAVRGVVELAGDPSVFVRRAAQRLGTQLGGSRGALAPALQRRLRRIALAGAAVLLPVGLVAALVASRRPDGWRALLHPVAAWRGTLLTPLEIADTPRRALRGATLKLTVRAAGRRSVSLRRRTTGSAWVETALPVADGAARAELGPLDADLTLVAGDGRATSDTVVVRVVDRPFLGDVAVRATYPAYLHLPSEALPSDGTIRVPRGTELLIEGHASEPLAAVALGLGMDSIRLAVSERRFSGRVTPTVSGGWSWHARGVSTAIADVPPPLVIEVVPDSAPAAEILQPAEDSLVMPTAKVELQLVATDDHALQSVTLRTWRVGRDGKVGPVATARLAGGGIPDWAGILALDLGGYALEPGDAVHVQLVARDETPWGQEGSSRELALRVPATEEQRQAAREAADSAAARAAAAARAQAGLQQRTSEAAARANRATGDKNDPRNSALQYEAAQQAKALAGDQKQMAERVRQLQDASRALEERLRAAGALDTALAAQLRDAQRMLREALTPEMLEALRKLDNSTQQLSAEQAKQSLAQLAEQQKKLREALEKSAEILKRAALEGALQTLRDEAEELAKAQRALADSAAKTAPDQAKRVTDRTDQLTKDIEALRDRLLKANADTAAKQAESALEQAQRAKSALEQGQQGSAGQQGGSQQQGQRSGQQGAQGAQGAQGGQQGAKQAAEAMERASKALAEGRKAQVEEWKQELTNELDRSVQEMIQLARQQDALAAKAKQNPLDPALRGEQSALQQGVQKASERLQDESKRSALVSQGSQRAVGQAEQKVAQAARDANDPRTAPQAPASMSEAAVALRQAATSLARDRERAAASQSASGLPELLAQLQQLAQMQGALNGQMQSLLQQASAQNRPAGLTAEVREQARGLAKAQRDVAKQLDDVGDADASGRAAELAREARQLAQSLEQGIADPTVLERQQRLFRRMLDAGRTLENDQQDESARRESRPGDQANPFVPPNATASGRSALKYRVPEWNELRGLSPEERRLVIEYFRRLNGEKP